MGRCPNCPLWIAIEGACEISDKFENDAVDDPRKPGAELQKRHHMQRRIFQSMEHRIKCDYTTDDEALTPTEEPTDEPVDLDAEAPATDTETDLEHADTVEMPVISKEDIIKALLAAEVKKVMACAEPYQMELQMFAVGNSTIWPDGHMDSTTIRQKNVQKQHDQRDGQYL